MSRRSAEAQQRQEPAENRREKNCPPRSHSMNLYIWLPAMFGLGIFSLTLCFVFLIGCEKI
jgi:hypothetical protein